MASRAWSSCGGCSDRWRAASSKSPKAWLAMTTSAGRAGQLLPQLVQLGRQLLLASAPVGRGRPGARGPPPARAAGGAAGRSESGGLPADRSLTIGCPKGAHWATLCWKTEDGKRGRPAPTRPPAEVRPGRSTAVGGRCFPTPALFRVQGPEHEGVMPHSRCT